MNLPLSSYLAIALAASIAGNAWQLHRAGLKSGEAKGDTAVVTDANASCAAALQTLQETVAEQVAGRVFDRAKALRAMTDREADVAKLTRAHERDVAALAVRLAGECREWAEQPACGVSVP